MFSRRFSAHSMPFTTSSRFLNARSLPDLSPIKASQIPSAEILRLAAATFFSASVRPTNALVSSSSLLAVACNFWKARSSASASAISFLRSCINLATLLALYSMWAEFSSSPTLSVLNKDTASLPCFLISFVYLSSFVSGSLASLIEL